MWHLLADCGGIEGRSGVCVVLIVRGVLYSERASLREILVWGSRVRIGLRPRLGHRRSIDHRAIHDSDCY